MKLLYRFILLAFAGAVTLSLAANDNSKQVDGYTLHYSVFNSDFLQPEVAAHYGLKRSKSIALINITVMDSDTEKTVMANITGNAYNLAGQMKDLAFKEIREGETTYYIANFRFSNEENLTFKLNVKPAGQDKTLPLQFTQTVYTSK